ncbi:MAG: radical SAM protein, partial [Deltaproteobacteria bacterium]
MATFHLLNFGCRASQADGSSLKAQLLEAGLAEASSAEQSHVAVLNTCTVTASADAEVRQIIRRIHRANPGCKILVTGCYAQRAPEEISKLQGVAWVIGNSHKHNVAEIVAGAFAPVAALSSAAKVAGGDTGATDGRSAPLVQLRALETQEISAQILVGEISEEFHFAPVFPDDRTRPTLKVQDGCGARCSFCIIPAVRGDSRSLALENVIAQIHELEQAGYKEIVLSGINLGSYGREFTPRVTFLQLLNKILSET